MTQKLEYKNFYGIPTRENGFLFWYCPDCKETGTSKLVLKKCPICKNK